MHQLPSSFPHPVSRLPTIQCVPQEPSQPSHGWAESHWIRLSDVCAVQSWERDHMMSKQVFHPRPSEVLLSQRPCNAVLQGLYLTSLQTLNQVSHTWG